MTSMHAYTSMKLSASSINYNNHHFVKYSHLNCKKQYTYQVLKICETMGSFFLGGFVVVLALLSTSAFASDPDSVQDFCVAVDEPKAALFVNGKFCKNPKDVVDDDFFLSGLNIPGNTANRLGSAITAATVAQLPGLNTLGISISRIDYAPKGLNPPHTHPRATEIFHLQEGILQVGFVTSNNPENRFFSKILHPGDVFVFPVGMIHFQVNIGKTNAVAFVSFNSQNPGLISIASAVFGSKPAIDDKVLAKTFDVDGKVIDLLQAQFN